MGLLSRRSHGELLARRGGAVAGVAALHALALLGLLHMHYNNRPEPELRAIQVANFQATPQRDEPRPDLDLKLIEPPPFEVVMPLVNITVVTPPPTAIVPPPPAPPAQVVQAVVQDAPVMLDVSEVDYQRMPAPRYPRAAKLARVQGTVMVWVLIGPDGRPREVRVHRSSGHEQLDREGCDAVKAAIFKPYQRNGVAQSAQAIVPVEFLLTARTASRG